MPDGADAYAAWAVSAGSDFVGRIRRSRHPAIGAARIMPDGAGAYPAYGLFLNNYASAGACCHHILCRS